MQATARAAGDLPEEAHEQDPPLSLWFWIAPFLLLLIFVTAFAIHRQAAIPRPVAAIDALPALGVVQFDSGASTLTPDGQAALDRAADAMRGNPNIRLRLEGYEAPRPKARKKDRRIDPLTLQRVLAVENYLDAKGIERTRVTGGKLRHSLPNPTALAGPNGDRYPAELYAQ